jgi:hypothetical protein
VNLGGEPVGVRVGADEDEQGGGRDGAGPARYRVKEDKFLQAFGAVSVDDPGVQVDVDVP